jgi:hypothetical protein
VSAQQVPFWARLLVVGAVIAIAAVPVYGYVHSRDLALTLKQFTAGKRVDWPPPPKPAPTNPVERLPSRLADRAAGPATAIGLAAFASVCALGGSRCWWRRRRARELATFELRLGRDDLANPYRVQEAFEGIFGAITRRWFERVWRGQDHFALEVHRTASDGLVRFTLALPARLADTIAGPLEALYPDVRLLEHTGRPDWGSAVSRLKKRRSFVLSLQTIRNYEHVFSESLASLIDKQQGNLSVQLVLCPTPGWVHRHSRRLLKRRERGLQYADHRDEGELGVDSVVEYKELKGALETQHRTLSYFELRVAGDDALAVRRVAGTFSQLRSENELVRRDLRLRRRLYARRFELALPNPLPGLRSGVLSTSELAALWQLPPATAKHIRIPRSTMRRALAPAQINRDPQAGLMRDEDGPVGIAAEDRKYGHALMGGQGGGKTSCLARHLAIAAADPGRAIVLIDGKGPLAQAALGMLPQGRTVHYLDLAEPELGFNPLQIGASPGATAAVFVQALVEANPAGAIQAASDSFLRQAIAAVCAVEPEPTLWHVYRMLDFRGQAHYRDHVIHQLDNVEGTDFARNYWRREFPALTGDRGFATQALNPPRNKLERLISTRETDVLLRHPNQLGLTQLIDRGEVLLVNAAKASIGEDNARLIMQLLLAQLHRALQTRQRSAAEPGETRGRVSLLFDEAHNVLTPSVATMLAEGRSAGLEAVFAWQYSAQIEDQVVRSGVRSLLQSISIFRMRELDDARGLAGLAMDVYTDRITTQQDDQARLRFSADDITRLETHHAINLWVAQSTPRQAFIAQTLPWEPLHNPQLADHHRQAQRNRGGHHPSHLPDPLTAAQPPADSTAVNGRDTSEQAATTRKPRGKRRKAAGTGQQLVWDDLEELD